MYKELIEYCEKCHIDPEKAYVAYLCDATIGRNSLDYEEICEETYKAMYSEIEEDSNIENIKV